LAHAFMWHCDVASVESWCAEQTQIGTKYTCDPFWSFSIWLDRNEGIVTEGIEGTTRTISTRI